MTAIVKQTVESASRSGKGVKIGGEWYNSKIPVFSNISQGSVISFEYTVGDAGGKFVKGDVTVDSQGAGYSGAKSRGKSTGGSDYSLGAAAGMAINNAITLCLAEKGCFDLNYVKTKAVEIYQLGEEFKLHASQGKFDIKTEEETTTAAQTTSASDNDTESEAPF